MSHSENKPKTSQTHSTNVRNLNIQDVEGITVVDSSGVNITTTDHGALEVAGDFALGAADAAARVTRDALDLGYEAIAANRDVVNIGTEAVLQSQREALTFADRAVGTVEAATKLSLTEGLDFGESLFDKALAAATSALQSAQDQVGDTVSALGSIAKDQSTSEASRLQQVTLYALAAVALVVIFGRVRG